MEDKKKFVKSLFNFYHDIVGNQEQISRMHYVQTSDDEWVYVEFDGGPQKLFNVNGNNNQGILIDFARFLRYPHDYHWLNGPDKIDMHKLQLQDEIEDYERMIHDIQMADRLTFGDQINIDRYRKEIEKRRYFLKEDTK